MLKTDTGDTVTGAVLPQGSGDPWMPRALGASAYAVFFTGFCSALLIVSLFHATRHLEALVDLESRLDDLNAFPLIAIQRPQLLAVVGVQVG